MFLFCYVFNFNAIARDNCYVQYKGLDTNKRSHLIIPENPSTNSSEHYFECGVGNQLFCNDGQLVAVMGKAKIATIDVENQFVICKQTTRGYEWVPQEYFEQCTENDVKSIKDLSKDKVFFDDIENAEMIYVNMSKGSYSRKELRTPIDDKELCFAYMCESGMVPYKGKCVYEANVQERIELIKAGDICLEYDLKKYKYATKGKYQYDRNIKCIVTECKRGYKPDSAGGKCIGISDADTGSANTGASQTNGKPSPAFEQAMSELEEINKALDEVMKRLQEEKQVKNDNVT